MIHIIEPVSLSTEAQAALAERRARLQSIELAQRALTNPPTQDSLVIVIEDVSIPEAPAAQEEDDSSCPICLETPLEFKTISGCGHKVCLPCEESLKNTIHQHKLNDVLKKKFVKCPICRSFEKPNYEDLEKEVVFWKDYSRNLVLRQQPPRPTPFVPQRTVTQQQARDQTIAQLIALSNQIRANPNRSIIDARNVTRIIEGYNRAVAAEPPRAAWPPPPTAHELYIRQNITGPEARQREAMEQEARQEARQVAILQNDGRPIRVRPPPLRRVRCNGRRPGCTKITQNRCHTCHAVQCCRDCIICTTCHQNHLANPMIIR